MHTRAHSGTVVSSACSPSRSVSPVGGAPERDERPRKAVRRRLCRTRRGGTRRQDDDDPRAREHIHDEPRKTKGRSITRRDQCPVRPAGLPVANLHNTAAHTHAHRSAHQPCILTIRHTPRGNETSVPPSPSHDQALNPFWGTALAARYKSMALPSPTRIREYEASSAGSMAASSPASSWSGVGCAPTTPSIASIAAWHTWHHSN